MRRCLLVQLLLLQAVAVLFLATSADILQSATADQATALTSTQPSSPFVGRRSLRNVDEIEERAGAISKAFKYLQVRVWAEFGASDDYVKNALHLSGLTGVSLTTHKNYNFYKYFLKKNEDFLLAEMFRYETNSFEAWRQLGLEHITKAEQLPLITGTDKFNAYKRYVNAVDSSALLSMKKGHGPPQVIVARGASEAEMTARTQIMAEAGRSSAYVKLAFGMTHPLPPRDVLRGAAVEKHADFNYFLLFLSLRKEAMDKELKELGQLHKLSKSQRKTRDEIREDLRMLENHRGELQ